MKKKHSRVEEDASIDMTPMLDIVFIMLIFFIVTTSFVKEKGLEVNRPENNTNQSNPENKTVSILIDERGMIYMNNRLIDRERVNANIQSFLAENNTDSAVVKAHPKVNHGVVVQVLDQAAEAGLNKLSVVVDK